MGILHSDDDDEPYDYSGISEIFDQAIQVLQAAKTASACGGVGPSNACSLVVYDLLPVLNRIIRQLNDGVGIDVKWSTYPTIRDGIGTMFRAIRIDEAVELYRDKLEAMSMEEIKAILAQASNDTPVPNRASSGAEGAESVNSEAGRQDGSPAK